MAKAREASTAGTLQQLAPSPLTAFTRETFIVLQSLRLAALLSLALAMPHLAHAHAVLVHAAPAAHGTVKAGSLHVALRFNSRIDGPRCTLVLLAPGGRSQPLQLGKQPAPDSLAADAPGLHPGDYILRWQALASDGHITRGEIPFHVQP